MVYVPGYDTHGLPTERKAIQALGIKREEVSILNLEILVENLHYNM